jgi:hypothetical protein
MGQNVGQHAFAKIIEELLVVGDLPLRPGTVGYRLCELPEVGNFCATDNDRFDEIARGHIRHRMQSDDLDGCRAGHPPRLPGPARDV